MEQYYTIEEKKYFIERKYNAGESFRNYQIWIDFFYSFFFYHSRFLWIRNDI